MFGVFQIESDCTHSDAIRILNSFLSHDEMNNQSVDMVKARLAKDSFMTEEFKKLLTNVLEYKSITEKERCVH